MTWSASLHLNHNTAVIVPLASSKQAAKGAITRNTERALRADAQIVAASCRRHHRLAFSR